MMQAMIQTVYPEGSVVFTGNHAVAAIAAVRAHKMIDAMGNAANAPAGTPEARIQIPYSSVSLAQFQYTPDETEVEDDNCKVRTPAVATGTLTLRNPNGAARLNIEVALMLSEPATYSGIEFSVVQQGGSTFILGTIPSIAAGESFALEGIPVGTQYDVEGATQETMEGFVPAEVVLTVSE